MSTVIVFGPTGNIASVAACTAQEKGAKVFLAMRDPQKSIPGLSAERERQGGFERVQADLTKPDTVATAVKTSGAKRAFIYVAHGSPDHMKSALTALKSAGIEFVVFLSSYTITRELRDVPPSDLISYLHAQVELNLDEVFGSDNYVAVRPGGFATNTLRFRDSINSGDVRLYGGDSKFDFITPTDMGRVSGTILVDGPRNGQRKVYLYGPQLLSQKSAIEVIAKVLGKSIMITGISEDEGLEQYVKEGLPKPVAEYLIGKLKNNPDGATSRPFYETGVENVHLYTGKPALAFEEWVAANKALFAA